jgi:hypothetical protein
MKSAEKALASVRASLRRVFDKLNFKQKVLNAYNKVADAHHPRLLPGNEPPPLPC